MTATPPMLTDRAALVRNRARALSGPGPALFLHECAASEVKERLQEVNRRFTKTAIVTGFNEFWQNAFPDAHVVADDDLIALKEDSYDLVIHAMALHWANDPVGQLVQARRALRPDGMFLAILFGGQTLTELRAVMAQAETETREGLSPRVAPMGEIRDLGSLLSRAGFALPVADMWPVTASYASLLALIKDLRAMGETSALAARPRSFSPRGLFLRASDLYSTHFSEPDNRVRATFELIILTGWAPAASQPRPLRPGSASTRLADALRTAEHPLANKTSN